MINIKEAEKFAKKVFGTKFKGIDLKLNLLHSKSVLKCCIALSKGKNADTASLKIAAWLHDIGRVESQEAHAIKSVEIAEKEFGNLSPIIRDCILNHGYSEKPETTEGRIIQLADKMSVMLPEAFIFHARQDKEGALKLLKKSVDKFIPVAEKFEF